MWYERFFLERYNIHMYPSSQKWELKAEPSMLATEIHVVEPMGFIGVTYINMRLELLTRAKDTHRQLS